MEEAKLHKMRTASSSSADEPMLWRLPQETWIMILKYLGSAEDLCSVSGVCRAFAQIASDDHLWRPLCAGSWTSLKQFEGMSWKQMYLTWLRNSIRHYNSIPVSQPPPNAVSNFDLLYRILIMGYPGSGKTSLLVRYADEVFHGTKRTIGFEFKVKPIERDGQRIMLQIWDAMSGSSYRPHTNTYFRGAAGILVVYDVCNQESFYRLHYYFEEIERCAREHVCLILVGAKSDLLDETPLYSNPRLAIEELATRPRQVSQEMGQRLADAHGAMFIETSALTGQNVDQAFEALVDNLMNKLVMPGVAAPRHKPTIERLTQLGLIKPIYHASEEQREDKPSGRTSVVQ